MNICRICLKTKPRKDISELTLQPVENGKKHSYQEIMEFCLGVQVTLTDTISTKLCVKCYNKIIEFYQFKALALKNDTHLRFVQFQSVVLLDDTIKKEEYNSEASETEIHFDDEPLVHIKEEYKEEYLSDDEVLCIIKNNKDSNVVKEEDLQNILKITTKSDKRCRKPKGSTTVQKKICDICGKAVKDLPQHKIVHRDKTSKPKPEAKFKCELCGKTMSSKRSIKRHIESRHLNIPKKCPLCGKNVKGLDLHIKTKHTPDSLQFQCPECSSGFVNRGGLKLHMVSHSNNKPFECEQCGKTFKQKITLQSHVRRVHNKERSHMCQFCSQQFFKKYHLQVHLRKHTNERPYECAECKKKFISSTTLKLHSLIHKNEKTYNCTICDNSFVSPNYLRSHMVSHIKDKKYPCQFCSVRFHRSDHRKRHEYTAHLKHAADGAHS